ncbi:hypothetical protein [Streptacidiphilus rugosus]|uniref:hypothetical protein n=1 Tax=Streptacidiphilus rugosus TaxID=405783 RepID=UPI00055B36A3|nr:hypothetical protein [Streptacidiphilus rugosus]
MATGPEHYLSAERLLAGPQKTAADRDRGSGGTHHWAPSQTDLLKAQVHATLALTAATALAADQPGQDWLPVVAGTGDRTPQPQRPTAAP